MIENDCIIYLIKMSVISSKIIASITLPKTKINKDNQKPTYGVQNPKVYRRALEVLVDEKTACLRGTSEVLSD